MMSSSLHDVVITDAVIYSMVAQLWAACMGIISHCPSYGYMYGTKQIILLFFVVRNQKSEELKRVDSRTPVISG